MTPVFQTQFNSGTDPLPGNCWQAVIASLLDLPLEQVPHFMAHGERCYQVEDEFLARHGYRNERTLYNPRALGRKGEDYFYSIKKLKGVKGFFKARVYSPRYCPPEVMCDPGRVLPMHLVIIDQAFRIVHDPHPAYQEGLYPYHYHLGYNGIESIDVISKL